MVGGSRGEQGLQYVPGRRSLTVLHGSFFFIVALQSVR